MREQMAKEIQDRQRGLTMEQDQASWQLLRSAQVVLITQGSASVVQRPISGHPTNCAHSIHCWLLLAKNSYLNM
jgi:hypothetical protein